MQIQTLQTPSPVTFARPDKHNIIIVDLSGSMSWAVDSLATDVTKRIFDLPENDYLSLAYFSGEGDHRWLVKGIKLSSDGKAQVARIVKDNFRARNTTCFSEVLSTSADVIKDIVPMSNVVSLAFMSDGHPVVSSYERELSKIDDAIAGVKGMLSDAVVVGYGDYYNRDLLLKMSQGLGATFTHAQEIEVFGQEVEKISRKKSAKRVKVKVPKGTSVVFTVGDSGVASLEVKDNEVQVSEADQVVALTEGQMKVNGQEDTFYAAALALVQMQKIDQALEVVGQIGDVGIATALFNAMTNDEIGKVEEMLKKALADPTVRFAAGKQIGCVPKENVFDLLDLLSLLEKDNDAKFFPFHPSWEYKRIGRRTKIKGEFPKFKADDDTAVGFNRLVWHESRLNLSIGLQIFGTVDLVDGWDRVNLVSPFRTSVFRNYAIVANGFPNVKLVPAMVSEATHKKLIDEGLVNVNGGWKANKIFLIDISKIPVCNRAKAKANKSAKTLAEKAVKSLLLSGKLKAYKSLLKEIDPEGEFKKDLAISAEQKKILEASGIFNGKYAPPTEQDAPTDVLQLREFGIKIAKYSSLPSVAEVRKQVEKNKLTPSAELVNVGLVDYEKNAPKQKGKAIEFLNERIKTVSDERADLQKQIQAAKFALLLGKQWFDDLKRDESKLTVKLDKEYDVSFEIATVEEKI